MTLAGLSSERIVNISLGAGAAVSPWWLKYIEWVSEGAAMILPVLGVLWIGIQIYAHFSKGK